MMTIAPVGFAMLHNYLRSRFVLRVSLTQFFGSIKDTKGAPSAQPVSGRSGEDNSKTLDPPVWFPAKRTKGIRWFHHLQIPWMICQQFLHALAGGANFLRALAGGAIAGKRKKEACPA